MVTTSKKEENYIKKGGLSGAMTQFLKKLYCCIGYMDWGF